MELHKHGLILSRMRRSDIEMVREHRNSDYVQSRMFYQEHITEDMQEAWFDKVNDHLHYYFIVKKEEKAIGLVHGIIHSFEEGVAEGGIFIWDETERNTVTPALASLILNDLTFLVLDMKRVVAEVRADNINALSFNKGMGYAISKVDSKHGKVHMELTKERYLQKTTSLKKYLSTDKENYDLTIDDIKINPEDREIIYDRLPAHLRALFV